MIQIIKIEELPARTDELRQCAKDIRSEFWVFDGASECFQRLVLQASPRPQSSWPLAARAIAWLRTDEDVGIGDTIHRVLGGDALPELYHMLTGTECGCEDRRARLNARWPYHSTG